MKRTIASIALAVLATTACGYTDLHEVVLRPPPGPTARAPDVYMFGQAVPRPFYELALLQVVGHGSDATLEDLMSALGARGRQLGCDAIVNVHYEQGYTMAHGFGVCVKYTRDGGASAPAAAPATKPSPAPAAPKKDDDEDEPDDTSL